MCTAGFALLHTQGVLFHQLFPACFLFGRYVGWCAEVTFIVNISYALLSTS
jgi:citrate synthase